MNTYATAFDAVALTYDEVFTNSPVGRAQRDAVWSEIDRTFRSGDRVLEINCGTGEDALHMAERGIQVYACDASPRMIDVARRKGSNDFVTFETLAIEDLSHLAAELTFDGVLSNFSGLNCVRDLTSAARDLARLVRPRGVAIICLFGRYCAWEFAWYLAAARPRKALRRLQSGPVDARVNDSSTVSIRYFGIAEVERAFSPWFRLRRRQGVGLFVPPTFSDSAATRHPRLLQAARTLDRVFTGIPFARNFADHQLFVFERTDMRPQA